MLEQVPENRPSAGSLLDPWQGIFRAAVELAHKLENRAFRF